MTHRVVKRFGGFSCAHRQHGHDGHCKYVHGYSIWFEAVFEGELDTNGMVVDFGKLRPLRNWLESMYDHTLLINTNDPEKEYFRDMDARGLCQLRILENVGMESRARTALVKAIQLGMPCVKVTCWENEKNAGEYELSR